MVEKQWSFIPSIYVATIENSQRIPVVLQELKRAGISNPKLNHQIPPLEKTFENITLSCSDNHQQIYRDAISRNYPYICVFEDDVYFSKDFFQNDYLSKIKRFVVSNGWDLLYLGHFPWKLGSELQRHPGIFFSISWCTHAYIISRSGMLKMLQYTPIQMMDIARTGVPVIANLLFKDCGGIDTYIAYQTYRGKLNSFAVYPMFVYQHSIHDWEKKALLAESMAINFGIWPRNIGYIIWLTLWIILGFVTLYFK